LSAWESESESTSPAGMVIVNFSFRGGNGGGCWISTGKTPAASGKAPAIDGRSMLASSEGGSNDGGGGWESASEPPLALGKPPTSDGGSTLAVSECGGAVPWMWAQIASVNMRAKCWLSRGDTQSRACEEDVAPEDQLKGEGESRCDGEPVGDSRRAKEPVGDSRRDVEPYRFIASAG
jgi:hypothetical protein